ncbi:DUF3301 domain-containing protein [Marinomonas mediterranea]|jgi:Protein of unknown function (DUF3301).|uniref:DUF3301 domain-containing protein n=1 Tax=Marinomonas mediterranea (strain ATCC 700492 / JCM 21426 / NBRC 103028 / MMB-1) TaxID=717774 RepID=F2JXA8_MARM1|nr:DUF3301 domain-containing protein [Marinomonas mediterranea]ADZ90714.1 hypothetical protein Marme_1447 [Marinomonas mediterranea MMB-1]WCN12806.1 DUF3301 domain-containing protein [Marinomonas mediterranea]WCN16875.1 DUF3301 domain-containing protein [Marinomonas mediterranea MMB-1]
MYISLSDICIALGLASILYAWWANIRAREYALSYVKKHCQSLDLQLLDDTVAGTKWRISWKNGQFGVIRQYDFEFTSNGIARYPGNVIMTPSRKMDIWLSPHQI